MSDNELNHDIVKEIINILDETSTKLKNILEEAGEEVSWKENIEKKLNNIETHLKVVKNSLY